MADETIARVQKVAQRLGYRPHFASKILNGRPTGIGGILFANAQTGAEDQNRLLALRLAERLRREGQSVFIQGLGEDPLEDVLELMNRGCEVFVFIGTPENPAGLEKALSDNHKAWLCVKGDMGRAIDSSYAEGVEEIFRLWQARGLVFRLLIETRDPDDQSHWQYRHRFAGLKKLFPGESDRDLFHKYVRFMAEKGDREAIFQDGYEATQQILNREKEVNALFFDTDMHALGGLKALREGGKTPGEDFFMAGANNLELISKYGAWPFPSVGMDMAAIEEAVVKNLFMKGPFRLELPPCLHIRQIA
jgi:DNA-binding LacI/PurR family transcriptional regulator